MQQRDFIKTTEILGRNANSNMQLEKYSCKITIVVRPQLWTTIKKYVTMEA
jgi:hypothetical protein